MSTEVAARASFDQVRYAQCWEDADVLVEGLDVRPGDACLSIASAGDNVLALIARGASRVVAVDLSQAQLHCLRLRIAAYRCLSHPELLELLGSRPSARRRELFERCRTHGGLDPAADAFWAARPADVARGVGACGKFERYFELFRRRVLPLVHRRETVRSLLRPRPPAERAEFYSEHWDTLRWRLLFRIFFSRLVMGRLGRDASFFRYVEGSVADRILLRARAALVDLDPASNPYLTWILTGSHAADLPFALRPENFSAVRAGLDRVELVHASIEDALAASPPGSFDRFNLSDIFEYMSEESTRRLYARVLDAARPGARLLYWNMLAPRSCPADCAGRARRLDELSDALHARDKAFFYSRVHVDEVDASTPGPLPIGAHPASAAGRSPR